MSKLMVVNGNHAAALGAMLARPNLIAAYPITPQTPIVEYLTQYIADGKLDSALSEVESEHSAMSVLQGGSLAGSRTFTATSSQGLALMYEPYFRTSTLRLPIVMGIANREMISPQSVWGGPQDSLSVRDAGWIQIYVEDNQEILDTVIQAFKVAENEKVLLPVNVCYDGFYLSHMTEGVYVPQQQKVDAFLPPYNPTHVILDPERPMSVDPLTPGNLLTEYRQNHLQAMEDAKTAIQEANTEYAKVFGRSYGDGLVEEYRTDDAEIVMVTIGSAAGATRVAIDMARNEGKKIGLLKIKTLRPFPKERIREVLAGRKAFGVIDRNVCFGWNTGIVYQEVCAAIKDLGGIPAVPFIGGLGGEDLTVELIKDAIDITSTVVKSQKAPDRAVWLIRK